MTEFRPAQKAIDGFVDWVHGPCMCESYYSYQCTKCRDVADGFLTDHTEVLNYCLAHNLVHWDSYKLRKGPKK